MFQLQYSNLEIQTKNLDVLKREYLYKSRWWLFGGFGFFVLEKSYASKALLTFKG